MAPIYEQLVKTFYDGATRGEAAEDDMLSFFEALAQSLLIWGSAPVIDAFNQWRMAVKVDAGTPTSLFAFEDLLFAIREDLGNDRKNLGRGDLLRVFVNDIDDFLAPAGEQIRPDDRRRPSSIAA